MSRVLATGQPIFLRGYSQDPRFEPAGDFNIESFLCVPLVSKERVLGAVSLVNVGLARGGAISESEMASITTLASLASTAIENAILHRDMIEKERIKANLDIARTIQRGMYPVRGLEIPGYDMAFFTRACDETGGDYFDFISLDDDRSAFVVGDVSGHGIGAALFMASGRANVRALLSVKNDLKEVMDRMNDLLASDMDDENFMTLFVGCLNHHDNSLTFVNAGHDEPLIYRARDRSVEQLDTTGLPAGMMEGWSYDVATARPLEPGDVLLLTTDGVWEGKNRAGERFGKPRLKEALALHAGGAPQDLVDAILKTVEAYAQGILHPDDFTVVAIKRTR
jgi:sigma-B regulation protein RsbU (phosphoserine phosphatase)